MICKRKTIFELIAMACTCACSFAFLQNNAIKFARGGDTIHSITIGYGYNHFPEKLGDTTLVNEVGTEVNCRIYTPGKDFSYLYNEEFAAITNKGSTDGSYTLTFFVNGIVSFDLNTKYKDYVAYMTLFRGDQVYASRSGGEIHIQDQDGLSTKAEVVLEVPAGGDFGFKTIVLKYSESSCRELSKK